jgi:pimeloyl-ACP methyl ester carboxylesterase
MLAVTIDRGEPLVLGWNLLADDASDIDLEQKDLNVIRKHSLPPTVVLTHGAWADGSSWVKVVAALHQTGIPVIAAPLPLTSLADDVAALDRALDRAGESVILVGHAYAGAVLGATRHESVKALVYVAALAPDEGETVADVFYKNPAHPSAPELAPDADGYIWLPNEAFASAFAQHASTEEHMLLAAVQRPIAAACIQEPLPAPRWRSLPSWYLVAEEDRMISPDTQRFMAMRMDARVQSHHVDHSPLITEPGTVADLVKEAYQLVAA